MYERIIKLSFMNDFSKDATSSLLVELGKTRGFAEGMPLKMSIDISLTKRISISIWPNKKAEEKTWKLFGEQVLRKVKELQQELKFQKEQLMKYIREFRFKKIFN